MRLPLSRYSAAIESALKEYVRSIPAEPKNLYDPIRYSLAQGGKRIRPLLTLIGAGLYGGKIKNAIHASLAVELFHNFTLLHDDIMDKAPLRRNNPTVHKKWDLNIAILSGDAMSVEANRVLLRSREEYIPSLMNCFQRTALLVCEGQQLDMDFENRKNVGMDEYMRMIELKTAVLLGAALQLGGLTAGLKEKQTKGIYSFGLEIGVAFQIKDDLLDTFSSSSQSGKKKGGDILCNKKTWLLVKSMEEAAKRKKIAKELNKLLYIPRISPEKKVKGVTAIFEELNIRQKAEAECRAHFNKGLRYLRKAGGDPLATLQLEEFALNLLQRQS